MCRLAGDCPLCDGLDGEEHCSICLLTSAYAVPPQRGHDSLAPVSSLVPDQTVCQ